MTGPSKLRAPRWQVAAAEFETSAADLRGCPPPDRPEIAVAGRSNVGKSSLLNAFTRRTGLARVSRTPGRTRLLNVFRVRLRGPGSASIDMRWVDLPGYGFARAHREVRDAFGPMIEGYLRGRTSLRGLMVLIDARIGPGEADFELFEFCAAIELPFLVCATKADKLGASERGLLPTNFARLIGCDARDVLITSATSGLGLTAVDRRGGLGDDLARLLGPSEDEAPASADATRGAEEGEHDDAHDPDGDPR